MSIEYYEILFTFGKYKGLSLGYVKDNDPEYLEWISSTPGMIGYWKEAATRVLQNKSLSDLNLTKVTSKKRTATVWCINDTTLGVKFDYDKELLARFKAEIDGRVWDDKNVCWKFPNVHLPALIRLFGGTDNITADDRVKAVYRAEIARRKELDAIRSQCDDIDIAKELTGKIKIPLYNYQNVAVQFVRRAGYRAMIADSPGLGKTATAIAISALNDFKTLIICPKSVVPGWYREIERFTGKKATIWSNNDTHRTTSQFHIIHYDAVQKYADKFSDMNFDIIVCDEATLLKNRNTIRAKCILGYYKERKKYPGIKSKYCVFLTGTPIMNNPVEAYHLLNHLDKNRINNFMHFVQRYGGWRGSKPRNLHELHQRTQDLVIRRRKKDVQKELPPKQRNDLFIELEDSEVIEYNQLLDELFKKWKTRGKPGLAEMPKIQQFLSAKKMSRIHEMVDELLSEDRSILIFSVYIEPLKMLHKHYSKDSVMVTGKNPKERQVNIDMLSAGQKKIGLFSIGVGSMGIDSLQHKIDTVLFIDRWWVPAIHEQAEDRLHRLGQKNPVQVFYLTCTNTIDEYMRIILDEKLHISEMITDGKIISAGTITKSFFKEFAQLIQTNFKDQTKSLDFSLIDDSELETVID